MDRIFTDKHGYVLMLEHGPGWDQLVKPLLEELEQLGGKALQVKEKFGGLRFYYLLDESHPQATMFEKKVFEVEDQSLRTCDVCGQPGELRSGGWIRTLCKKHYQEQQLRIKMLADDE